jgi:hypothetical protein
MKYRDKFMLGGIVVVLVSLFATDPDSNLLQALPFGGSTIAGLLIFSKALLALAFAHYGRKVLFDYPEGDFQVTAAKALEGSTGAGLLAVAYAIVFFGLVSLFGKGL